MSRKKARRIALIIVVSATSLFVLAKLAHQNGKRLGIRSSIKNLLARFDRAPEGYPVTVRTRKGERIYFDIVHLELVDAWHPEEPKPEEFRLETDGGGQLTVGSTLTGVTSLKVLQLPRFPKSTDRIRPIQPDKPGQQFNPALLGTHSNSYFPSSEAQKKRAEYTPLLCKLQITFGTGKVTEGKVTLHHEEFDNRVWGNTPEGPRHMALSHIASITLPKSDAR